MASLRQRQGSLFSYLTSASASAATIRLQCLYDKHGVVVVGGGIRTLARQAETSKDTPKQKMSKVVPKAKKETSSVGGNESDRMTDLLIRAIDAQPRLESPSPSAEEMKRRADIGRQYVIGMFQRENSINHDLACKLKFKNHAIQMLPKNHTSLGYLRQEALYVSMEPEFIPPIWRPIPVDTPPIAGFDASQFIIQKNPNDDDDDDDDEKEETKKIDGSASSDKKITSTTKPEGKKTKNKSS